MHDGLLATDEMVYNGKWQQFANDTVAIAG